MMQGDPGPLHPHHNPGFHARRRASHGSNLRGRGRLYHSQVHNSLSLTLSHPLFYPSLLLPPSLLSPSFSHSITLSPSLLSSPTLSVVFEKVLLFELIHFLKSNEEEATVLLKGVLSVVSSVECPLSSIMPIFMRQLEDICHSSMYKYVNIVSKYVFKMAHIFCFYLFSWCRFDQTCCHSSRPRIPCPEYGP